MIRGTTPKADFELRNAEKEPFPVSRLFVEDRGKLNLDICSGVDRIFVTF
jgi:hypothetical protein